MATFQGYARRKTQYKLTTDFGDDFESKFPYFLIAKKAKFHAPAAAGVQILKNRCFHYFSDFHFQEHPKRELKSNILEQVRLRIPFEKRVEISSGFLLDF